nr:hypothetical protein [uncultured Tyzzerella sp.]
MYNFLNNMTMLSVQTRAGSPASFINETITLITGIIGGAIAGLGVLHLIMAFREQNPAGKQNAFLEIASGGALLILGPKIAEFIVSYFN